MAGGATPTYSAIVAHTSSPTLTSDATSSPPRTVSTIRTRRRARSLVSDALDAAASASPSDSVVARAGHSAVLPPPGGRAGGLRFAVRAAPAPRHVPLRRAPAAQAAASGGEDRSVETAAMRVLSMMSGEQAQEMRGLEREYQKVLDANCRAYAAYLKQTLLLQAPSSTALLLSSPPPPPELVFGIIGDGGEGEDDVTEAVGIIGE
jgi:hypothetical protein